MKPSKLIAAFSIILMAASTFAHGLRSDHPNYCEIKFDIISIQQQEPTKTKKDCCEKAVCVEGENCDHKSHQVKKNCRHACEKDAPIKSEKPVPVRIKSVKAVERKESLKIIPKRRKI